MRFFLLLTALLLAGCGFHLRSPVVMPFDTLHLKATNPGTLFILDLRRSLKVNNITLVDEVDEADVVLDVVFETADKQVLSLGVDGRVNEFRLNYRVSLRAYDLEQQDWLPAEEFTQRRDFSYDDTQIFAKEAEEVLLQKNMRTDMVQQIIRRLGNARPQ